MLSAKQSCVCVTVKLWKKNFVFYASLLYCYTFPNKVWWTRLLRVGRYFTSMCQNSSNFILHSTSVELIFRTLSLLICLWYITWESWDHAGNMLELCVTNKKLPRSTTKNYYIIINFFINILQWQLLQKNVLPFITNSANQVYRKVLKILVGIVMKLIGAPFNSRNGSIIYP